MLGGAGFRPPTVSMVFNPGLLLKRKSSRAEN